MAGERTLFCAASHVRRFCSSIFITPFAWKLPRSVLLGREKMMRFMPSNSSNLTGGGGSIGTRRITDDSTCGGGLKSLRDTLMMLSTFAYSYIHASSGKIQASRTTSKQTWTLADNLDQRGVEGFAVSRRANSRWNMRIATRNRGR
jgi:hypothetical protein